MTRVTYVPVVYHTTLGTHPPALHIADGDTVVTSTVDSTGRDARDEQVTAGGNPQSGPFYIEGAEPGDTVALHLDRLSPNRDTGFSAGVIAPNVLEPHYLRHALENVTAVWSIDRDHGTATLTAPDTTLGHFVLPLAPMLGCFGVAPPRGQAISTATSGQYGGNMDYRGFQAGVTAYFPVFVPGALVHVGDAHAVQGDGEIVGTGIEVSCDVEFTVRLLKGKRSSWPRGENADYIFTVGNARPLDQAVQHATTEMVQWLQDDYGFDALGAHILLGQCVEYDLGNMFDPAYTMVCKVSKRFLPAAPRASDSPTP